MNDDSTSPVGGTSTSRSVDTTDNPQSVKVGFPRNGVHTAVSTIPQTSTVIRKPPAVLTAVKNTFSSLSNRNFLFLWIGMLFLMGGTQMHMLAQGYLVYEITGSGAVLGIVNLGIALPMLTIPFFGGAIADRFDRRTIIQGAQIVAMCLALVIGIMINTDTISWPHLMISSMIQGGLFAFMMPARQAIIPQLVGPEKLPNALALNAAGISAMTMAAPALAGWLYASFGPWNVFYIISAMSLAAVVVTTFITKPESSTARSGATMIRDIYEGFSYVSQRPILIVLLLIALGTTILAMPFRFILPVFVVDIYKLGPDSMGLLVGIMGAGAMIGALYVASVGKKNRGRMLIISSFLSGFGLLLVALVPIYSFAAVIMIMLGLGDSGRMSLNQALLIEETEDRFRGRVMSIYMLNFGLMPLGTFPAGLLTDYLGGQAVVGAMAVMLLVLAVVILVTQKQLRKMP